MTSRKIVEFCERWNATRPTAALMNAIEETFPQLSSLAPPIDLYELARLRGVAAIEKAAIEEDGLIYATAGGYVVQLNQRQPEERQRFTLAHEIAHIFFFPPTDAGLEGRSPQHRGPLPTPDAEEERLCNIAAAEILMPGRQFSTMLDQYGFGARAVLEIAQKFRTSIQATANRVVALCPYSLIVCSWQRVPSTDAFETVWVAKPSGAPAKFVVGVDQPGHSAFLLKDEFRGRHWVSLGGPIEDYFLDGIRMSNGRVITSIMLDNPPDVLLQPRHKGSSSAPTQSRMF